MKKRFKGFTLVECIVALAILGIASLTMAQIYASVSQRNKMNHLVNTSLSNQMAYVEKYTDSETVPILETYSGTTNPPHTSTGVRCITVKNVTDSTGASIDNYEYSFPVDIYVLKSRDRDDHDLSTSTSNAGYTEDDYNLRYKYVLGHTS